jgi:hypothetical protein
VSDDDLHAVGLADPDPDERARAASQLLDELLGGVEGSRNGTTAPPSQPPAARKSTSRTPAKKQSANSSATKKAAARKQPAKGTAKKPADKAINAPRHTAPSRFDTVEDD